mmetsp:Transcript_79465/g.233563  ORF Transcript_79465/g.233563 Transcript_79465/m.233563 type:complete len:225 (+) Transcript_79465:229-903(+)
MCILFTAGLPREEIQEGVPEWLRHFPLRFGSGNPDLLPLGQLRCATSEDLPRLAEHLLCQYALPRLKVISVECQHGGHEPSVDKVFPLLHVSALFLQQRLQCSAAVAGLALGGVAERGQFRLPSGGRSRHLTRLAHIFDLGCSRCLYIRSGTSGLPEFTLQLGTSAALRAGAVIHDLLQPLQRLVGRAQLRLALLQRARELGPVVRLGRSGPLILQDLHTLLEV